MDFKNTILSTALAASLGLTAVAASGQAQNPAAPTPLAPAAQNLEKKCSTLRVDSIKDTTGNIIVTYLADSVLVNLDVKPSAITSMHTTVDRGFSKDKTLYVVSRKLVQTDKHTKWTWNESEAKRLVDASEGKSTYVSVKMTPNNGDYMFAPTRTAKGDALIVDLDQMVSKGKGSVAQLGQRLQETYRSPDCSITLAGKEKALDASVTAHFGTEAQSVRESYNKVFGANSAETKEIMGMTDREVMVNRVAPDAQLYTILKENGVVVQDIVEVAKTGAKPNTDRYAVSRRGPSEPTDYVCVGWYNSTMAAGAQNQSVGCRTPATSGSWQLEYTGTQDQLKSAVGERMFASIVDKARSSRAFAPNTNGAVEEQKIYAMNLSPDKAFINALSPNIVATDRQGLEVDLNVATFFAHPARTLTYVGVQRVNAPK